MSYVIEGLLIGFVIGFLTCAAVRRHVFHTTSSNTDPAWITGEERN